MAARTRRTDDPKLAAACAEQWRLVAAAVDALPDERFGDVSSLPGWTVGDLVAHCARSGGALEAALAAGPGPASGQVLDTVGYLGGVGARAEAIADKARSDADGLGPAGLRARLRAAVDGSALALDLAVMSLRATWDTVVASPGGPARLGDFVVTRCVEGVVHGLDLGVTPARDAVRIVTRALVDLLAARAPGGSVELRVPPYAAVQVVEGPRHTRGTPPNIVECDPVAFVLVAAGRLDWATAVGDGRITASGERADLRPYLPIL